MLINGKTGNRNGQQNRKTEVFQCKNRKSHGPPLLSKHNKTRYLQNTTQNSPPLFLGFGHLYSPSIKVLDYYDKTGR